MKKITWTPRDIISVIIVVGSLYLLSQGINNVVATALLAVVAFYYGAGWLKSNYEKKKKSKEKEKETKKEKEEQ